MSGGPFVTEIQIRFRDQDPMGHVNNAVYVTYLECGRVDYWRDRFGAESTRTFGVILGEVHLRYLASVELQHEVVMLHMGCCRIGTKSFEMAYELRSRDNLVFARARTAQVGYDYRAHQTVALPDSLVETLKRDLWTPEGLP